MKKSNDLIDGVSVVISTYNGKDKLEPTLLHLAKQICDFPVEIILVDNASTDGTKAFADDWWHLNGSTNIQYYSLVESRAGKMYAQQTGFSQVRHSYILICDDDNWLEPDYLQKAYNQLKANPRIGMLGGQGEPVSDAPLPDWFDKLQHMYAVGPQSKKVGTITKDKACVYGAGSVIVKSIWDEILEQGVELLLTCRKGNQLTTGGDNEMGYLIVQSGYDIHWDPSLRFKHFIPTNRLNTTYVIRLRIGFAHDYETIKSYKKAIGLKQPGVKNRTVMGDFFDSIFKLVKLPIHQIQGRISPLNISMEFNFHIERLRQIILHGFIFHKRHKTIRLNLEKARSIAQKVR